MQSRGSCAGAGIGLCLGLCALSACATTPVATWAEREDSASGPSVEVEAPAPTKLSAAELARSLASAGRCLQLASEHDQSSKRKGWSLLQACARRADFVDLDAVLREPWLKRVQGTPEGPRLLAHVVAHRGGKVWQELGLIQTRKVPLLGLEQAMVGKGAPAGSAVLLRGRIVVLQGPGADWQLAIDEEDYVSENAAVADPDSKGEPEDDEAGEELGGVLDAVDQDQAEPAQAADEELIVRRSGRRVLIKAGTLEPGVKAGLACVALIRFGGPQDCAGPRDKAITACAGGTLVELLTTSGD